MTAHIERNYPVHLQLEQYPWLNIPRIPKHAFFGKRIVFFTREAWKVPLIRGFCLFAQTETIARAEKNPWSGVSVCSRRPKLLHEQRKTPDQGFLSVRADRNYCTCGEKPLIRGFCLLAQNKTIARESENPWSGVSWILQHFAFHTSEHLLTLSTITYLWALRSTMTLSFAQPWSKFNSYLHVVLD